MGHVSLNLVCVCTNYDKGLLTIESAKEILEIHFEKTTVARTRVQSVLALGTFTAVL